MKTKTSPIRNSISRSSHHCGAFAGLLGSLVLALTWLTLAPKARAQCPQVCDANLNTALGIGALSSLTTGLGNTAIGIQVLDHNTTGSFNTANGGVALESNTTGNDNTANGYAALFKNTTGNDNTSTGFEALYNNTTGDANTANGHNALFNNTTGSGNTAIGFAALLTNTIGEFNTANGADTLASNTTGSDNTANGAGALLFNTIGNSNTAAGLNSLGSNTSGNSNTATGFAALISNTTGGQNTANGFGALFSNTIGNNNTASGINSLLNNTTGSSNIAVGAAAGTNLTTGNNNIDIGNAGVAGESNRIRIDTVGTQTATFIAGISGANVPGGVGVIVGNNGKLGTVVSSARFKDGIKPMDKASEAILALKPVTFRYKPGLDAEGIPQFGLVAEDVEEVNPDLVGRDADGKAYTVRYEAVNAMLLNEFLKEHRTVQELKKEIAALTATVQKVSAQVEMSRPAPQTVVDNH